MYWIDVSYKVSLFSLFFREKRHFDCSKKSSYKRRFINVTGFIVSIWQEMHHTVGLFVFSLFKFIFPGMIQRENIIHDVNSELTVNVVYD